MHSPSVRGRVNNSSRECFVLTNPSLFPGLRHAALRCANAPSRLGRYVSPLNSSLGSSEGLSLRLLWIPTLSLITASPRTFILHLLGLIRIRSSGQSTAPQTKGLSNFVSSSSSSPRFPPLGPNAFFLYSVTSEKHCVLLGLLYRPIVLSTLQVRGNGLRSVLLSL